MINTIIIGLAAILLLLLLHFERTGQSGPRLCAKTVLSCLFILAAIAQPKPLPAYFALILAGLVFSLGGDVFLALRQERMFLFGILSFLIGHVFYIPAFFSLATLGIWTIAGAMVTAVISGAAYWWLRGYLGSMKIPVRVYIFVISLMMVGAWSLAGTAGIDQWGRAMAFAGASCFYLSDILVARDRFYRQSFINRLVGLPLYYLGQFLLAFSIGLMKVAAS